MNTYYARYWKSPCSQVAFSLMGNTDTQTEKSYALVNGGHGAQRPLTNPGKENDRKSSQRSRFCSERQNRKWPDEGWVSRPFTVGGITWTETGR